MKQITFEFKPGVGAMYLDSKFIKVSADDYDTLKDAIDPKYKHGYILMAGNIISENTYNYEFTNKDYQQIINYIQNNLIKEDADV